MYPVRNPRARGKGRERIIAGVEGIISSYHTAGNFVLSRRDWQTWRRRISDSAVSRSWYFVRYTCVAPSYVPVYNRSWLCDVPYENLIFFVMSVYYVSFYLSSKLFIRDAVSLARAAWKKSILNVFCGRWWCTFNPPLLCRSWTWYDHLLMSLYHLEWQISFFSHVFKQE